jgi:hypothetical protein
MLIFASFNSSKTRIDNEKAASPLPREQPFSVPGSFANGSNFFYANIIRIQLGVSR